MNKILITGIDGFVGTHLSKLLMSPSNDVYGFDLKQGQDLLNYEQVRNAIDGIRPNYIYHLAAQAFVPESFTNPKRAIEVNTIGSLNILEAVKQLGVNTKILLAGTSEEYGDGRPAENAYLEPKSPYAIAKVAMDYLGRWYANAYGINVVITRAFNHTGPGRGEMYAESSFAKQIVEIENGNREVLKHGNLDSVRNYTDVRDVVRAYQKAIDLPSGVYNICSNQNVKMQEVLSTLKRLARVPITTKVEQSLYRPTDFSFKKPKCNKIRRTGWKPEIKLETTMNDLLDYWRDKYAS